MTGDRLTFPYGRRAKPSCHILGALYNPSFQARQAFLLILLSVSILSVSAVNQFAAVVSYYLPSNQPQLDVGCLK